MSDFLESAMKLPEPKMIRPDGTVHPEDQPAPKLTPLPDNALDGFRNGACLDLRVRFAMEMLTHSPMFAGLGAASIITKPDGLPNRDIAKCALDVATELFALAESRGLIEPLGSPDGERHLAEHITRQINYQAPLQFGMQREGQRLAEQSSRIASSVRGAFGKHNG